MLNVLFEQHFYLFKLTFFYSQVQPLITTSNYAFFLPIKNFGTGQNRVSFHRRVTLLAVTSRVALKELLLL